VLNQFIFEKTTDCSLFINKLEERTNLHAFYDLIGV